jgi:hypothetical protein
MPDRRKHRGAAPEDAQLFAEDQLPRLRPAAAEFAWLLSRGYAESATLKLVGDRHNLTRRQRDAIRRSTCADSARDARLARELHLANSAHIDGFNLIITIESALAGGVLLRGREGCVRDLSSVHGSYRKVDETLQAIELIAEALDALGIVDVCWLLDRPVSNSARLAGMLRERWPVELLNNPDAELIACDDVVISSDALVLDGCQKWLNLASIILARSLPAARVLDLWQEDA